MLPVSARPIRPSCLIVDDDVHVREALRDLFVFRRWACELAKDGMEASKFLTYHAVDVLVTDICMPRMNGAQLLQWCRHRGLRMPVIIVTGENLTERTCDLVPGDCYSTLLSKPVRASALFAAIEDIESDARHTQCAHSLTGRVVQAG